MKIQARYENGVLIPEKPLHPNGATLTIDVPDENFEPEPTPAEPSPAEPAPAEPAPAEPIEWTEAELKMFENFPGLRKAWEILRGPIRPEEKTGELSAKQAERWEAINYMREGR